MSQFRNASGGRYTKALFYEETLEDKSTVVYTLKDRDHLGYPSLYRLYMEMEDLTEYDFASKYLDGWEHWQMICNASWFRDYIQRWRQELHLKVSARALNQIKRTANGQTRDAFAAQRYLLEKGWVPKDNKNTKGRPSKEDIKKEALEQAQIQQSVKEDYERVMGRIN